jgi:protein-L-isoaspartate(D-aspartate) O-methyltransferase
MIDSYKHKGMRERLGKLLAEKGITDTAVLQAIQKIPRHAFVESTFAEAAYEDRPLPIGSGQTISQPYTVARQTELLDVKPGMKVLEIGTGSAYQAAVLCALGVKLFSIERIRILHDRAREILEELGFSVRLRCGDGSMGWETYAPYDRILVTAASPSIPETFKKQLAIGGKLVIPVGDRDVQAMSVVRRDAINEWTIEKKGDFKFVPMIGKHGWETE